MPVIAQPQRQEGRHMEGLFMGHRLRPRPLAQGQGVDMAFMPGGVAHLRQHRRRPFGAVRKVEVQHQGVEQHAEGAPLAEHEHPAGAPVQAGLGGPVAHLVTQRPAIGVDEVPVTERHRTPAAAPQALAGQHPDCFVQTHVDENPNEISLVAELYPDAPDYMGVYEAHGLLGPKTLLGHCIHMTDREDL